MAYDPEKRWYNLTKGVRLVKSEWFYHRLCSCHSPQPQNPFISFINLDFAQ